jgi:hypothetical protein
MSTKFYFVVFNTVANKIDFSVFLYSGNSVSKQAEIMQRLQLICKDFSSQSTREYERKVANLKNDYIFTSHLELKEVNNPVLENSKVCFIIPEEDKYIFVDLKYQLEYFGFNGKIKGYDVGQWFDYHFKPYNISDEDFKAVADKLKTLEKYRDHLVEIGSHLSKLSSVELESYLEVVGLY